MNTVGRDLKTLFDAGTVGALSNGRLLDRFLAHRHEADFAALVERLGPMVWSVCLRILRDHHDAEDAFQATFLVLARKAASIHPREKVGHWLYGVAFTTARKARSSRTKRLTRERPSHDRPEPNAPEPSPLDDHLDQLDHELNRLPEKYRIPILLCELQGQTHQQAAAQLGWPIGTVSGRLSRARSLLARRLNPRGTALSVGSLGALLAQKSASAEMPRHLISFTAQAATLYASGRALSSELASAPVAALSSEVVNAMWFNKLKLVTIALVAVLFSGAGLTILVPAFIPPAFGQEPEKPRAPSPAQESPRSRADAESRRQYLKARVETAREIFMQEELHMRMGIVSVTDEIAIWSRRWMEDELLLRTDPAEKLAAIQDHIDRLLYLEKKLADPTLAIMAYRTTKMKYFRLEAEQQRSEFHARHPDIPLPEPGEPETLPDDPRFRPQPPN